MNGVKRRLSSVAALQLSQNVGRMILYCVFSQMNDARNLSI
jgi:hypothetical protein